jgi:hypothetical protein
MFSLQIEQLARQRQAEREAQIDRAQTVRSATATQKPAAPGIRRQTGWAIVSIGLRIAESGNR